MSDVSRRPPHGHHARRPAGRPPPGPHRAASSRGVLTGAAADLDPRSAPASSARSPGRRGPSSPRSSGHASVRPTAGSPAGASTTSGRSSSAALIVTVDRHGRRRPRRPRARRSTSPSTPRPRVRERAQADPRDPGRHPARRPRLLRRQRHRARRSCSGFSERRRLFSLAGGRASASASCRSRSSRRCPRTPCARVPHGAPRGELRHGRQQDHHRRARSWCPPRSRAWWPRSSSPSPGPSARRWSCSSPPGPPATSPFELQPARAGPHHDGGHGHRRPRAPTRSWARRSPSRASSSSAPCSS